MGIHNLGFRDLRYIVAIADQGSFGRAANACGITQPALSERVKRIESTLDTCLFERNNKSLHITPTGRLVLEKARELLDQALTIDEITSTRSAPLSGPLRLGIIATLGPYLLPKLLPVLRAQYPQLELILDEGLTEPLLGKLQAGTLDLIIAAAPLDYQSLIHHSLFQEDFILAAPVGHPIAKLKGIDPKQLSGNDMLLLEDGHCLSGHALKVCPAGKGQNRNRLHAMSLETLRHMVAGGAGYTLLPALAVGPSPPLTDLISYRQLHKQKKYGREIVLAYRKTYRRGPEMKILCGLIRDVAVREIGVSSC